MRNLIKYSISLLIVFVSCNTETNKSEYIRNLEERREITEDWMENDLNSPFNFKGKIEFDGLKYFEVDSSFVFKSKLFQYENKDTLSIFGTKGEERTAVRYGYLPIAVNGRVHKLNVYENLGRDSSKYYSIWFSDRTTNRETYGVGRYLSFDLIPNRNHLYTIDFNLAYNPYCAYNSNYSCAIPTKEDYLDIAIRAGEKKYHH